MRLTDGPTVLRRLTPDDVGPFLAYRSDPEVAKFQSWDAMGEHEAIRFLDHMQKVSPLMRTGQWTQIAVSEAGSDFLIGDMGWHLSESGREIELGITLARAAQGLGHATRAIRLAIDHLSGTTQVSRFKAYADLRNAPSRALLRRSGFTSLGTEIAEGGIAEEIFAYSAK